MIVVVAIGDTKQSGILLSEYRSPIALSHLLWCSLEGIVSSSCLSVSVGCIVMFKLQAAKQIVLTQLYVHLVGNNGILGLSLVAIGKHIAKKRPSGIMALSIAHYNLYHRRILAILIATRLILERIGGAQGIMKLTELAVQLGCKRCEMELRIIAA